MKVAAWAAAFLGLVGAAAAAQEPAPSPSPSPEASPSPAASPTPTSAERSHTLFESTRGSVVLQNRAQFRFNHERPDDSVRLPGTERPGDAKGAFRVRRAKTELSGWFWRPEVTYELQLSWAGPEPGASTTSPLEDLVLTWEASGKRLRLSAGQFKVPLGRQELTPSHRLQLVDRDILDGEFTRGRDVGVMVHGLLAGSRVEYRAGAFNGNPASRNDNDNGRYQWNARVMWQPWGPMRYSESDLESHGRPVVALGLQAEKNNLHGSTNADDLDTRILGADAAFKHRGLSLFAEYFGRRRVPETSAAFGADGFHAQAGCFLIRRRLEVAFRYARYDPTSLIPDNDRKEVGGGVNVFLDGHALKFQSDFRQIDDQGRDTRHREFRLQTQVVF